MQRLRDVAMATSGRDDGGRENVEKEEERSEEEDETQTPVDGQLQRRHDQSQVSVISFNVRLVEKKNKCLVLRRKFSGAPHVCCCVSQNCLFRSLIKQLLLSPE